MAVLGSRRWRWLTAARFVACVAGAAASWGCEKSRADRGMDGGGDAAVYATIDAGADAGADTGADAEADLGPQPHGETPLWTRQRPCNDCSAVSLFGWPKGDVSLLITTSDGTFFITHLDETGQEVSTTIDRAPPTGRWQGARPAAGPDGALFLASALVPEPYLGALGPSVVRKIDAQGTVAWQRSFDLPQGAGFETLVGAADGSVLVFGNLPGTFDFGGGPLTSRSSGLDGFVLHLDANGAFVSAQLFATPSTPVDRVALSATGLLATAGNLTGTDTSVVNVFDAALNLEWSHVVPGVVGSNDDFQLSFIGDDVILGGYLGGSELVDAPVPAGAAQTIGVTRFDALGHLLWSRRFSSDYAIVLAGLSADPHGNVFVSGSASFFKTTPFSFGPFEIPQPPDELGVAFIGKLDPNGNALWAHGTLGAPFMGASPRCAADADGAVRVVDLNAAARTLTIAKYGP